jgi:hypothetical protein
MEISSELRDAGNGDNSRQFTVTNPETGRRFAITFGIAELAHEVVVARAASPQPVARPVEQTAPAREPLSPEARAFYARHEARMGRVGPAQPVEQTRALMGWQPIETAPTGATGYCWMNLAWGPADDVSTGVGMRWGDRFFAAGSFYCLGQEKRYEFREIEVQPTHWMPLPESPTAARPASGETE